MNSPRFAGCFEGWRHLWEFADEATTLERLASAGFEQLDVWLEAAPTTLAGAAAFADFVSCVCIRHHLERLPPGDREDFVRALTEQAAEDDPAYTLDYCRLNILARKPRLR